MFRSIRISALNIAMHKPHSPELYMSLIRDAQKLNTLIPLGALHAAMLGPISGPDQYEKGAILTGEIYRCVKLDASEPWFNLETSEEASDGEMVDVQIPEHLLPHLQRISFIFRPDNHQLWFISHDRSDNLGPKTAATFLQRLFDRACANGRHPQVEVTVLPDMATLEEMFSLTKLEKMTIDLKRPNADDNANDEIRWLKKLEDQGVQRQETKLIAAKGESIKPDEDTRALAMVAAHNGSVSVVGKDADGFRIEESTLDRPMVLTRKVNPKIETSMDVLIRTAYGK